MHNIAIWAVYRLRVTHQLGGCTRAQYLNRMTRICARFGVNVP